MLLLAEIGAQDGRVRQPFSNLLQSQFSGVGDDAAGEQNKNRDQGFHGRTPRRSRSTGGEAYSISPEATSTATWML